MQFRTIHGDNVATNYAQACGLILEVGQERETRGGQVLTAPYPVLTITDKPWQRVLVSRRRDANPFFHLFESIWMLAGQNDGTWLDQFVSDFSSRYAEVDGTIHGAYGYRWRGQFVNAGDQLKTVAERLKHSKSDRRAVIQMWSAEDDLYSPTELDDETGLPFPEPRDIPCNTQVYVKVRDDGRLTTTVTCRSNDIVWGCYGANAVHFSVLHEWLAAAIGVPMGPMYQLSDDWHLYKSVMGKLDPYCPNIYASNDMRHFPMFEDAMLGLEDAEKFVAEGERGLYMNPFFDMVAVPMLRVHRLYKEGYYDEAYENLHRVLARDWQLACRVWLDTRMEKKRG